ncbi:urease accessory protein [Thalassospira xiamenensis M-5 = DSM 17429]|uniref:Urease accessory protein UreE n=1 Tax=Thalassospira xiamenensis M-5 = DSM 17429 TaxID=1123366 RepID=A0AB72UI48_9PROT|nr:MULTISPECIES: urease accessory protein UreE [Thalassospira]AJD53752.1 UreE urease accessory domain-containing protein [Thalassospira xiamenensis M-5 = DSM 17429]PXX34369.1 urease accessory protein [Thalassospira sp. 11-3]SIS53110.1 urease accessory protein [Thalassospira xiamenensis M-5 = DSM 17429]
MRRAIEHIPVSQSDTSEVRGTVTLAFADRHRRRIRLLDDAGDAFLLDLPHAVRLGDGDRLRLVDGGVIVVRAAAEDVLTITCSGPIATTKMAWHIGNRHTPLQVLKDGRLRIIDDHVMRDMVEGLGGVVFAEVAPFDPLNGAYHGLGGGGHGHSHGNDHFEEPHDHDGHNHDHAHSHGHSHSHAHAHAIGEPHDH